MLFQEGGLFDSITVAENVAYPLVNRRSTPCRRTEVETRSQRKRCGSSSWNTPWNNIRASCRAACGAASESLARWSREPPLVLYDSPTAGLDPITANTIMALIAKERDLQNTANAYRDAALSGRATDGQFSIQSQQWTFGADIH